MSYRIITATETICDSRNQGSGVINPVLTMKANKVWTLEFTLHPKHHFYDKVSERITEVGVCFDNSDPVFWGTVMRTKVDFYGQKTVYCEDILSLLNDAIAAPLRYSSVNVQDIFTAMLTIYNDQKTDKPFQLGTIQSSHTTHNLGFSANYDSVLTLLMDNVVGKCGGYLRARYRNGVRYLDYTEDYGTTQQVVSVGSNLLDYVREQDRSKFVSILIPLGAVMDEEDQHLEGVERRVTIITPNRQTDRITNYDLLDMIGPVVGTKIWGNIEDPDALYDVAYEWVNNQVDQIQIDARAFDLNLTDAGIDRIELWDEVLVQYGDNYGYFPVTELVINLNNPSSDKITLGKTDYQSITYKTNNPGGLTPSDIRNIATSDSIVDTDVEYYVSTSQYELTGGSWSTDSPEWEDGSYIWTRTKFIKADRSYDYSAPACITGASGTGTPGAPGAQGVGVSSIVELYYLSASNTLPAAPAEEVSTAVDVTEHWTRAVPSWAPETPYYYTCSQIYYSDGTIGWSNVVGNSAYNSANSTANSASEKAQNALDNSSSAIETAQDASEKAQNAKDQADRIEGSLSGYDSRIAQNNSWLQQVMSDVRTASDTLEQLNDDFYDFRNSGLFQNFYVDSRGVHATFVSGNHSGEILNDGENIRFIVDGEEQATINGRGFIFQFGIITTALQIGDDQDTTGGTWTWMKAPSGHFRLVYKGSTGPVADNRVGSALVGTAHAG